MVQDNLRSYWEKKANLFKHVIVTFMSKKSWAPRIRNEAHFRNSYEERMVFFCVLIKLKVRLSEFYLLIWQKMINFDRWNYCNSSHFLLSNYFYLLMATKSINWNEYTYIHLYNVYKKEQFHRVHFFLSHPLFAFLLWWNVYSTIYTSMYMHRKKCGRNNFMLASYLKE